MRVVGELRVGDGFEPSAVEADAGHRQHRSDVDVGGEVRHALARGTLEQRERRAQVVQIHTEPLDVGNPFHAAGGLVTAIVTESTPAMQAALSASRPPMPPEGTYSSAPPSVAARSKASRKRFVGQRTCRQDDQRHTPARSNAGPNIRTASCEAASTTTSGRAANSASGPITKGTPNSAASGFPARRIAAPDDRDDFHCREVAGPDMLETQAGDRASADDGYAHCLPPTSILPHRSARTADRERSLSLDGEIPWRSCATNRAHEPTSPPPRGRDPMTRMRHESLPMNRGDSTLHPLSPRGRGLGRGGGAASPSPLPSPFEGEGVSVEVHGSTDRKVPLPLRERLHGVLAPRSSP